MKHVEHLSKDKKMKKLIEVVEPYELTKRKNVFLQLCSSIMSQQLSTKVAEVIYKRFLALYDGKMPSAQQILDTPATVLRGIGLSNAKVSYVHNVARFEIDKGMDTTKLNKMTNEEVVEYLTQIKGVGKWTVEMILMFTLGREDVFAVDDLGIQQSMIKLYRLKHEDKKELRQAMLKISGRWAPYRTYACMYLWRWKDGKK
ncbi:MAG TPA: DNA-3-methyladenine glycosylase [Chitinophagaceae bacterium]